MENRETINPLGSIRIVKTPSKKENGTSIFTVQRTVSRYDATEGPKRRWEGIAISQHKERALVVAKSETSQGEIDIVEKGTGTVLETIKNEPTPVLDWRDIDNYPLSDELVNSLYEKLQESAAENSGTHYTNLVYYVGNVRLSFQRSNDNTRSVSLTISDRFICTARVSPKDNDDVLYERIKFEYRKYILNYVGYEK